MVKQYGLVFDLRRCIGCRTCVIACKAENRLEDGSWMTVLNNSGGLDDIPTGRYPDLTLSWQPVTCMHCRPAPCLEACPEGAIEKRPDGIVLINGEKCTGCRLCEPACPYRVVRFDAQTGRAGKCTLCSHRIDAGLEPFCVKECVWGAIRFGDTGDPRSEVSQLVSRRGGRTLSAGTGNASPSSYYLPP